MSCYTSTDPGACGCGGGSCSQNFTVEGCGGLPYEGLTVEVYDSTGTTLLDSGTTDASGDVTLSWTGTSGSYVVEVTGAGARFDAYSQTLALTCGHDTTIGLTPASGYECCSGCLLPLADTLFLTDSVVGGVTLSYDAFTGTWIGTIDYSFPGCPSPPQPFGACDPLTVTLTYSFACTVLGDFTAGVSGAQAVGGGVGNCCPNSGGADGPDFAGDPGSAGSCPAPLSWSTSWTDNPPPSRCYLYCGATATITVTE